MRKKWSDVLVHFTGIWLRLNIAMVKGLNRDYWYHVTSRDMFRFMQDFEQAEKIKRIILSK